MNTNEILVNNDDIRFFIEVHLLASKLVPVVVIHSLGGSRANRHHTPNLQSVPHNQHKMRITQATSNPLVYLLALHRGKVRNSLAITTIAAGDNHLPLLDDPCYTKTSRWWQPPRVTRQIPQRNTITKCL
jgi:hypothetical protein